MTVAIVGSRSFSDYSVLHSNVKKIIPPSKITKIVSGGAHGANFLAERFADQYGIPLRIIYPNWSLYGKRAGAIRNELIVKEADLVIAFWDGISPGTKISIDLCDKLKKDCKVIQI
jgi:hypothetical protein